MKLMQKLKQKKGFTLIELVVVIAVIAILAAIAIPYFSGVTEKANQSTDLANYRMLKSAAASYLAEGKTAADIETGILEYLDGDAIPTVKTGVGKDLPFEVDSSGNVTPVKPDTASASPTAAP